MSSGGLHGPHASSAIPYRADIDWLRAIAVLLVLVFHFRLVPLGKAGFIGVDMFFVISGYLITTIVLRRLDKGTFSLGSFYTARIRRLAPGLVVVLTTCLVYGWFRLLPMEFEELARQAAAAQFYVSNIYYWRNVSYFGLGAENVYLLHTWSLAVEEQFYLAYPLLLMLLHRRLRSYLWWVLGLLAITSFALNVSIVHVKASAAFYLLPTRGWQLIAGALIGQISVARWKPGQHDCLGLAGAGLVVTSIAIHNEGTAVPGWYALLPVLAAACLLLATAHRASLTARALSIAPMVYIGRISYVLYLVHWPIHVFAARELGADYGFAMRAAMFLLSIALSAAICRWAEDPVRGKAVLQSAKSLWRAYGSALVMSAVACVGVVVSKGLPLRLPSEAARLEAYTRDKPPALGECEFHKGWNLPPPERCRLGAPSTPPRWLIFGDSHAWAAQPAFNEWLKRRGESGWLVFQHQCPPLLGVHLVGDLTDSCHAFNDSVYKWLETARSIDRVVIVSAWIQASEGILASEARAGVDVAASLAEFDRGLAASLARLKDSGKTVYVWGPVPGAKGSVPQALARASWRNQTADVMFSRAEYERQYKFFFQGLAKHANQIDALISPARNLCQDGHCKVVANGGTPLYSDSAHLTASTVEFWANVIEDSQLGPTGASLGPAN